MPNIKEKLTVSIGAASFFVLTLLVFAPSHMFLTNPMEFSFVYSALLARSGLAALCLIILLAFVVSVLPNKYAVHKKTVALLCAASVLFWLQGNVLVYNYGLLNGEKLRFSGIYMVMDAAIWLGMLLFAFMKSDFVYKRSKAVSFFFIIVQLISVSALVAKQPPVPSFKRYEYSGTDKFTFSKGKNVIILALDSFQTDFFQKIIKEDKTYEAIFDGFVFFRNSLADSPSTSGAVPCILTGKNYDNSVPMQEFIKRAYSSNDSIPKVLLAKGFRVGFFGPPSTMYYSPQTLSNVTRPAGMRGKQMESSHLLNLCASVLFRYLPDCFKAAVYQDGRRFLGKVSSENPVRAGEEKKGGPTIKVPEKKHNKRGLQAQSIDFFSEMMAASNGTSKQPVFKYYHLWGCHAPFLINENLEYEEIENDPGGIGYTRAARGCLRLVKAFFGKLKQFQAFDNSLIFIVGDHGSRGDITKFASPLFLVKKFNSKEAMRTSDVPVALSDIPKTVFTELGLAGHFSGRSVFDIKESELRPRRFLYSFSLGTDNYMPPIKEYQVLGPVWLEDSWKLTGREFVAKFPEAFLPVDLNAKTDILESKTKGKSSTMATMLAARFDKGWAASEGTWRWTTAQEIGLVVRADFIDQEAALLLRYKPMNQENELSVYLNGVKIKDCGLDRCGIERITFKKGENMLEFRAKLPPERPKNHDPRLLSYCFTKIQFFKPNKLPEYKGKLLTIEFAKTSPKKEPGFAVQFDKGWSVGEPWGRWTISDKASMIIDSFSENKKSRLFLRYVPLRKDNTMAVYLNNLKIKDCGSERCEIEELTFKKGLNILEFRAKLPAQIPTNGDPRSLCYCFQMMKFFDEP